MWQSHDDPRIDEPILTLEAMSIGETALVQRRANDSHDFALIVACRKLLVANVHFIVGNRWSLDPLEKWPLDFEERLGLKKRHAKAVRLVHNLVNLAAQGLFFHILR